MPRKHKKSFYITLIAVAVLCGMVLPAWFIRDMLRMSFINGLITYAATSIASIFAAFVFIYAHSELEVRGAQPER